MFKQGDPNQQSNAYEFMTRQRPRKKSEEADEVLQQLNWNAENQRLNWFERIFYKLCRWIQRLPFPR